MNFGTQWRSDWRGEGSAWIAQRFGDEQSLMCLGYVCGSCCTVELSLTSLLCDTQRQAWSQNSTENRAPWLGYLPGVELLWEEELRWEQADIGSPDALLSLSIILTSRGFVSSVFFPPQTLRWNTNNTRGWTGVSWGSSFLDALQPREDSSSWNPKPAFPGWRIKEDALESGRALGKKEGKLTLNLNSCNHST